MNTATTTATTATTKYRLLLALACESSAIGALSLESVIAVCTSADWDYDAAKARLLTLAQSTD